MTALQGFCAGWLALAAAGSGFTAVIKAMKYRGFGLEARLGRDDLWIVSLVALGVAALGALGPAGAVVGGLGGALLFFALWLDAVLFRVFTIELGPGGVGSVILSVLYRELSEMDFARRFFGGHRIFAALPAVAVLAHAGPFLAMGGPGATGLFLAVGAYLAAASVVCVPAPARRQALAAVGALGSAVALPVLAPSWTVPAAAVAFGAIALSRALGGKGARDPYGIRHFLRERPLPDREGFTPRPEHAQLVTRPAAPPRSSAAHGLLRGRDVVLLTFESVGRSHLSAFSGGGARTPFLEGLLPGALRSRHHACVSPTTNNAHLALYGSRYGEARFAGIRALRDAGYRTVYLTAARCAEYGLRSILDGAGFEHVVDRAVLGRDRVGPVGDEVLVSEGLDRLAPLLSGGGPFFLHVHATNTHVPYRVADPERFGRFDPASDQGRFFNGIEECDALFGALLDGLKARGLTRSPLIVVSSDHGQAFGKLGYHSHGSAITRDQLDVPLVFHHPELASGEVPFSSHFDVLPTMLDLLGLTHDEPIFGDSLLHPDRRPEMLVWAGHPSRATTSHYGVLLDGEKLVVDLVLDRCWRMDWQDERVEELSGAEKEYASALASRLMALRRVA